MKRERLERLAMGIFSSSTQAHGEDPDKPWEVSEKERLKILAANKRAATRLAKEAKGAR